MHERYAVIYKMGEREAAGALEVGQDRLLLEGRGSGGLLELDIPVSDLTEVRVARRTSERLNGYQTLLLDRKGLPLVQVAPLGGARLQEIASLLASLNQSADGDVLAVFVPLKQGCIGRARRLLAQGPPLDPGSLGLTRHEVYLREEEAVFVFRGADVGRQVAAAARQPAVWRAGLAWQRCFAGAPQIRDVAALSLDAAPSYAWSAAAEPPA